MNKDSHPKLFRIWKVLFSYTIGLWSKLQVLEMQLQMLTILPGYFHVTHLRNFNMNTKQWSAWGNWIHPTKIGFIQLNICWGFFPKLQTPFVQRTDIPFGIIPAPWEIHGSCREICLLFQYRSADDLWATHEGADLEGFLGVKWCRLWFPGGNKN